MSVSAFQAEQIALEHLESVMRAKGYNIIRHPDPGALPPFLKNVQPDAIAVGRHPSLVLEVFRSEGEIASRRIHRLRDLLREQNDWELRVFYYSSLEPSLYTVPHAVTSDAIEAARRIAEIDSRAALLLAWSVLEAVARSQVGTSDSRALSPPSLVNFLVGEGYINQEPSKEIFRLSRVRSRLAHGQLDVAPSGRDVEMLLLLAEEISLEHGPL